MSHAVPPIADPLVELSSASEDLDALFATIATGASRRDQAREHPFDVVAQPRQRRFAALRLSASRAALASVCAR